MKSVGFSLTEIILAVGILAILAAAVAYTVSNANSNFNGATDEFLKARYAQEGYEAVKAITDKSWASVANLTLGIEYDVQKDSSGIWFLTINKTTRGTLSRRISFAAVQRDGTGAIVSSGGQVDNNTRQVTIKVFYVSTGVTYQLVGYITNKNAYKFRQTAWNGTTGVATSTSLTSDWYSGNDMTGTSTVGALTMVAGSTSAFATSSAWIVSYASTSAAIKNQDALTLEWTQNVPTDCVLRLYLEATNSGAGGVPLFSTSTVVGPITASTSGTATTSINLLEDYSSISNKRWVRYGVSMRACSGNYPTLYGLNLYVD